MTVRDDLIAARDLLVSGGWIQDYLRDDKGSHCAIGAIVTVADGYEVSYEEGYECIPNPRSAVAIQAIHLRLPEGAPRETCHSHPLTNMWGDIAEYNNTHTEADVVDLFNRTIASLTNIDTIAAVEEIRKEVTVG